MEITWHLNKVQLVQNAKYEDSVDKHYIISYKIVPSQNNCSKLYQCMTKIIEDFNFSQNKC